METLLQKEPVFSFEIRATDTHPLQGSDGAKDQAAPFVGDIQALGSSLHLKMRHQASELRQVRQERLPGLLPLRSPALLLFLPETYLLVPGIQSGLDPLRKVSTRTVGHLFSPIPAAYRNHGAAALTPSFLPR